MHNHSKNRIVRSKANPDSFWKELLFDKVEPLLGETPNSFTVLANFIHLSDIHICDAASPARLEFLDRLADRDNPISQLVPYVGTYRAQEFLTTQVFEAMVDAANKITAGPVTNAPIDAVVITGDVTDNAQKNEFSWYMKILEGGQVTPTSGDQNVSEASHSSNPKFYDVHYYHPDGPPDGHQADRPHTLHGFPHFPGVLKASESSFFAQGLRHKWLAVHGNHDALLQGTALPTEELNQFVKSNQKLSALRNMDDLPTLFSGFGEVGPAVYPGVEALHTIEVTPDSQREFLKIQDWVETHTECGHDHGLDKTKPEMAYWCRTINKNVRLIALDTVNRFGGWQGCIHREQFEWLADTLERSRDKYVILTSHHPLEDLFNGYTPEGEREPALKQEVSDLLDKYPNIILWFAGHVHDHKIFQHERADGSQSFWHVRTGSHIDWPQQSRIIEIVKTSDHRIAIATQVFDHSGPIEFKGTSKELEEPIALAGLSRLLAANDWQRQDGGRFGLESLEGTAEDRNIWLWINDPL